MMVWRSQGIRRATWLATAPGFTFLEVLIALCIVLIALVPLIRLHLTSIRMIDSSSRMARATLLANARLAEIRGAKTPDLGKANGEIKEDRGLVFHWGSTITEADLSELTTSIPGLRRVHVDVTCQDATVSVDTFIRVPVQREQKDTSDSHDPDSPKTDTNRLGR